MKKYWSIICGCAIALQTVTGCSAGWEPEEREAFVQNCQAAARQTGESWPLETCSCITEKMEAKYPNPNDIAGFLDSLSTNPVLLFDTYPQCRVRTFDAAAVWTKDKDDAFLASCQTAASQGLVSDAAQCPCVLEKVKKRFPTLQSMHRLNATVMGRLAQECQGKLAPQLY